MEIVLLPYKETIEDVVNGCNSLIGKVFKRIYRCFLKPF